MKNLSDFKEVEIDNKQEETDELFQEAVSISIDSAKHQFQCYNGGYILDILGQQG